MAKKKPDAAPVRPLFKVIVEPGADNTWRWRQVNGRNGNSIATSKDFSLRSNAIRSARLQVEALTSAVLVND